MTEYITKEHAIDEVWDAFMSWDDPDLGRVIEENIERFPAADVAPVVHGKWIGTWGDGYIEDEEGNPQIVYEEFECSNCGQEHLADGEPEWDYCPNCGARMDGEEENLY